MKNVTGSRSFYFRPPLDEMKSCQYKKGVFILVSKKKKKKSHMAISDMLLFLIFLPPCAQGSNQSSGPHSPTHAFLPSEALSVTLPKKK